MSPERMEGEKYSAKGDIWSLGLVIVEMMTGKFPKPQNPKTPVRKWKYILVNRTDK